MNKTLLILFIILIAACSQESANKVSATLPVVLNLDDKTARKDFSDLKLDSMYVDLMDSRNTSEDERQDVYESWTSLHNKISLLMAEEGFKWEVPDSSISIMNRIYFNKEGNVEYFVFKVMTPSVTSSKKEDYSQILQKFSQNLELGLSREEQFAQCGKTRYMNK